MQFFHGFSLDTLLGIISCLLGVVALIIGSKAYHNCNIMKGSMNDDKAFHDNSGDFSQRAGGDIINNTCDTNMLSTLTAANFQASLNKAYEFFEQQSAANLQSIIDKTNQIIQEHKPNLAGLTKIDWINIYFESAKNTSDEFMQDIWARVLAKEVETPCSFSYKTLDVLKNMSFDDYCVFSKLCSFAIDGTIPQKDIYSKYGLLYMDLIKLSEIGLLTMGLSQRTYTIRPHSRVNLIYHSYLVMVTTPQDTNLEIEFSVFLLTSVAKELQILVNAVYYEDYAKDFAKMIFDANHQAAVSVHRIIQQSQGRIEYQKENLLDNDK